MSCGHPKTELIFSNGAVELNKCRACGLIFRNNISRSEEIYDSYYEKNGGRFGFGVEHIVKVFRFWRALKIYLKYPKAKSILDIGSGRGWTLCYLKKYFRYQKAVGIQISQNAYNFSKENLGLEVYNQDFLELNFSEKFDIVTLWHVLEHLHEPDIYLDKISGSMDSGEILMIEVPNYSSWTRKLTGKYWLALDPKHHINFFTEKVLKKMLIERHFKIKNTSFFSLEYSAFTSAQSLLNLITGTNDYFFRGLQERKINFKMFFHAFIFFMVVFPLCLLINIALYFTKYGEIINIIAWKDDQSH